jgi:hypothetical protein
VQVAANQNAAYKPHRTIANASAKQEDDQSEQGWWTGSPDGIFLASPLFVQGDRRTPVLVNVSARQTKGGKQGNSA